MEYYWVLKDKMGPINMYWTFDELITFFDVSGDIPEKSIVESVKVILPENLTYTGGCTVQSFDPKNGHLPDTKKKLVIIDVSNGLSTVGPIWSSGTPEKQVQGKTPKTYYKLG